MIRTRELKIQDRSFCSYLGNLRGADISGPPDTRPASSVLFTQASPGHEMLVTGGETVEDVRKRLKRPSEW